MNFKNLFPDKKPVIACIHLLPLPGSPAYQGKMSTVLDQAIEEVNIFISNDIDGLIIENFRDVPFYPQQVPPETIASMSVIVNEITKSFKKPLGINVLRNDAHAALAIANACNVHFIRVNVHTGAAITDQGIIEGQAYRTLRMRKFLYSEVLIFADVAVKHSTPLGNRLIEDEVNDLSNRGLADAVIVTGSRTGSEPNVKEIKKIKQNTDLPVIIGSGITTENLTNYIHLADGFIVGSYFKKDGIANNLVDKQRVKQFMNEFKSAFNN